MYNDNQKRGITDENCNIIRVYIKANKLKKELGHTNRVLCQFYSNSTKNRLDLLFNFALKYINLNQNSGHTHTFFTSHILLFSKVDIFQWKLTEIGCGNQRVNNVLFKKLHNLSCIKQKHKINCYVGRFNIVSNVNKLDNLQTKLILKITKNVLTEDSC